MIHGEKNIEIKSTDVPNGRLLFDTKDHFKSDYAILAVVSLVDRVKPGDPKSPLRAPEDMRLSVRLVGRVSKANFDAKCHIGELRAGHGTRAFMFQSEMRPMSEFPLPRLVKGQPIEPVEKPAEST